jgi:hypothetical protein
MYELRKEMTQRANKKILTRLSVSTSMLTTPYLHTYAIRGHKHTDFFVGMYWACILLQNVSKRLLMKNKLVGTPKCPWQKSSRAQPSPGWNIYFQMNCRLAHFHLELCQCRIKMSSSVLSCFSNSFNTAAGVGMYPCDTGSAVLLATITTPKKNGRRRFNAQLS